MDLQGIVEGIRREGITSTHAMTDELNRQGISAPRGGTWHPTAVSPLDDQAGKHPFPGPHGEGKLSKKASSAAMCPRAFWLSLMEKR